MKKYQKIIICVLLLLIAISLAYLFYNQAIGNFGSDLPLHIAKSPSSYSITNPIYNFIINYLGGNYGIAIFLALIEILNILLTKKILKCYLTSTNDFLQWFYAILLNFVIAIYLPFIHKNFYLGTQTGNVWHNSTYICMRPLGLIAILLYFKIQEKYLNKIDIKYYILFCLCLIVVNAIKPSFIVTFAPTMLVFLIIDFFKNIKNKKAILNIIIFGCAVLISLPVLFYQNNVLFKSSTEGNSIGLGLMTVLRYYHKYPIISLLQSAAFPIFILLTNLKTIFKNRNYSFVVLMNIFGLAEFLFLQENNIRLLDGNFSWQYFFTLFLSFIFAVIIMDNRRKESTNSNKTYFIICYILLGLHILSGIFYFTRIVMGYPYSQ